MRHQTPLVPLVSSLRHWDHHWYIWLPGDPVYEAVEVMAAERRGHATPLVWVFFTERGAPKRQAHYFNDPRVAALSAAESCDIAFAMTGAAGQPCDVSVSLVDLMGRPIEIAVGFGPDACLTGNGAGLTDQFGHNADRMLLILFREASCFAQTWRVTIAGADVQEPQPGQPRATPFPAAYGRNIFVGLLPFADLGVSFGVTRPGEEKGMVRFAATDVAGTYAAIRPDGTSVELVSRPDAALQCYRHRCGPHVLEVQFVPPLPAAGGLVAAADASYRISLDQFHDLLTGSVHASRSGDAIILNWNFDAPDWTRAHPLRTTAYLRDETVERIELRRVSVNP